MNILFLDSIDRDVFGGYENWILQAAEHFAKRGCGVTVAGRPGAEYLRRAAGLGMEINILELGISGDFNPLTIRRLKRYLSDRKIDVMTVNFNKDVRLGGLAAQWYGKTRVVWRIGLDITRNGLLHRLLSPRLVDGVIVPSQALKNQVTRYGYLTDEMVRVIHIGAREPALRHRDPGTREALREKYGLAKDSVVAVTVGRFVDQKGHIHLVEAARRVVQQAPETVFLFLGNGPREQLLRGRIDELGLERHFCFAGMLDSYDLELAGADLQIHPSVEEPFSFAILDGMRTGLPIVASRVGGIPEVLIDGESAILVPPREPQQLAAAVVELLSAPEKMRALGEAGRRRWEENFRVEKTMNEVESYITALLT
jgi:glycosyltransferase involved in cell wall biosynthesis